jgi:signal transduction histidine kinase
VLEGSETVSGMGVGLYLSSQIVTRHGGVLTVKSQKGEGSVFSFSLPIAE